MCNSRCLGIAFQAISMTRQDSTGPGTPRVPLHQLEVRHQLGLFQFAHNLPARRLPEIGFDTTDQGLPCI